MVLGVLLVFYVAAFVSNDRARGFFSDEGMLPLDVLARLSPGSARYTVFQFAHTPTQALTLFAIEAALAICVAIGFCTRVTAPLALLGVVCIHHRIAFNVNASMVTMHLLGILWVFLPLGRHASVDAWLARRRGERRAPYRVRSLAPFVLRLQLFAIYYFNSVHKSGPAWRDGSAVHYVLYGTHTSWPWTMWLRSHEPRWLSPLTSYSAIALEMSLAVLMVFPAARARCRRLSVLGMAMLHLGIVALADLGPFPFVFGAAALMLWASEDGATLNRLLRVDEPLGEAPDRGLARLGGGMREALLTVHLLVSAYQTWPQNHAMTLVLGPAPRVAIVDRYAAPLYVAQAWAMFAADAPRLDRLLITTVTLDDGRVLDVETRRAPSWVSLDARYAPADFLLQLHESRVVDLHDPGMTEAFARYQGERPRREGWLGRARVSEVTVNELWMTRPAPGARVAPVMNSRVIYTKRWLPTEGPARFDL